MKSIVIVALIIAAVTCSELEQAFQEWRVENHKFYSSANEYKKRFAIFSENVKRIEQFNKEKHSFTVGVNYFTDLTNPEFQSLYTMGANLPVDNMEVEQYAPEGLTASRVDWREEGIVNQIKDQGQCGSCWSFGANAAMEGAWAQAGNSLASFSEQNILDCSWSLGNQGCNGGWHNWAMQYVINNNGVDSEASYPYTAKSSKTCLFNAANVAGRIKSFSQVKAQDEKDLANAVNQGVVAIAIDASHWSFQTYKSGVYDEKSCSPTSLDHAVAAVGYDTTPEGIPYWIVRNSWGTSWGNQGYIWMSKDKSNQCGVATKAYIPRA